MSLLSHSAATLARRGAIDLAIAKHDASRHFENALDRLCRALPRRVRYQAFIGVLAEASTDAEIRHQEVPGMTLNDLLRVTHRRLMTDKPEPGVITPGGAWLEDKP